MRINVVGTSGAGKSTIAKRLAQSLRLPYVQMDQLFWLPNWGQPSDEVYFPKVAQALEGREWVLDGNYDRTIDIKWARVQTVVWADYSFPRVLCQAICRAIARSWANEELWPGTGNRESFRQTFLSRESVLLWTLKTYKSNRKRYSERMQDKKYAHIKFVRLRNPRETEKFLNEALVDAQIEAYGQRDTEAFAWFYAEDAQVYRNGARIINGNKELKAFYYQLFQSCPALAIRITDRKVQGDWVCDTEVITGLWGNPSPITFQVRSRVQNHKIAEVHIELPGDWSV